MYSLIFKVSKDNKLFRHLKMFILFHTNNLLIRKIFQFFIYKIAPNQIVLYKFEK